MSVTCVKCSRVNPKEAAYCYFDGYALDGHGRGAGPVAVGAQRFTNPFVFPSGRTSRSFDELAVACQEDWDGAKELLAQGFFGSFFGGMGRADLARAAEEARKFGDLDRGLDTLLDKLPTHVLQEPKLRVDPQAINLGTLKVGEDRELDVHLDNQGMRLLYGKVTAVDTPWLTLGEGQGVGHKLFQCTHETTLRVHVKGNKLRAKNKPQEGKLLVDSNGGDPIPVLVRVEVPVKPFPGSSTLAGARSPRQVAEKSKANPKAAALLFEKGEVAEWYKSNGWVYPVQGPTAAGVGAVQQFFEALGLTPPPKVDISHRNVALSASAGQQNLRHVLEVRTDEKRPVYAHGTSNQPWLEVSRAKLNGRVAAITLTVPMVPDRPGETLTAKVLVQANGNQKFVVPVSLQIGDNLDFTGGSPVPTLAALEPLPVLAPAGDKVQAVVSPVNEKVQPAAAQSLVFEDEALGAPVLTPRTRRRGEGIGVHWISAALLALVLLILVIADVTRDKEKGGGRPDIVEPDIKDPGDLVGVLSSTTPKLRVGFTADHRFGFSLIGVPDPRNNKEEKKLTFDRKGATNNTVVKIGNDEYIFGSSIHARKLVKTHDREEVVPDRYWTTKVEYRETGVVVTQHVLLAPGSSGKLDNCLVYYSIYNGGDAQPEVGLRVLLDTYIGANDGVPFTVPGKGLVSTLADLRGKEIPDFVEAIENDSDVDNPGTVARFGLHLKGLQLPPVVVYHTDESTNKPLVDNKGKPLIKETYPEVKQFDEMTRLVICQQPDNPQGRWEPWGDEGVQPIATELKKDSCAAMYWEPVLLNRKDTRVVGFTYGLSALKIEGGKGGGTGLALSAPAGAFKGKEFTVTAYVYNARKGQEVTLELPDGMELAGGEKATRQVEEAGRRQPVYFRVQGNELKTFKINGRTGNTKAAPVEVRVRANSIFG